MTEEIIYPFKRGQFLCTDDECKMLFYAQKEAITFEDELFVAVCPECGKKGYETHSMRNLHGTIGSAKGANMSEAGREKNKLNGYSTGSSFMLPWYKGKIPMPPAKPGKYSECDSCHDLEECKHNVEEKKGTCIPVYCHRKTEVTLKYAASFMSGDPETMRLVAANNAAQMQMVLNASYKKIFDRGCEVVEKIVDMDKDGNIVSTTEKVFAHPLIKQCVAIMQTMGFTLTDWTMTPKSKEAKEQVAGFLAGVAAGTGKSVDQVVGEHKASLERFIDSLQKAKGLREGDQTLKTFETEMGQRDDR